MREGVITELLQIIRGINGDSLNLSRGSCRFWQTHPRQIKLPRRGREAVVQAYLARVSDTRHGFLLFQRLREDNSWQRIVRMMRHIEHRLDLGSVCQPDRCHGDVRDLLEAECRIAHQLPDNSDAINLRFRLGPDGIRDDGLEAAFELFADDQESDICLNDPAGNGLPRLLRIARIRAEVRFSDLQSPHALIRQ